MAISKFESSESTPTEDAEPKVITTPGGKQIEVNEDGTYADGSTQQADHLTIKLLKEALAVFESEGYDEDTEVMASYSPQFVFGQAIPLRIDAVSTAVRNNDNSHVVVLGVTAA